MPDILAALPPNGLWGSSLPPAWHGLPATDARGGCSLPPLPSPVVRSHATHPDYTTELKFQSKKYLHPSLLNLKNDFAYVSPHLIHLTNTTTRVLFFNDIVFNFSICSDWIGWLYFYWYTHLCLHTHTHVRTIPCEISTTCQAGQANRLTTWDCRASSVHSNISTCLCFVFQAQTSTLRLWLGQKWMPT